MSRATLILNCRANREKAARWAMNAPAGTRVEFKEVKRSLPQNDRMWAMLTEVAQQVPWHGVRLTADDWKLIFLAALFAIVTFLVHLSVVNSRQHKQIKDLAQELSLLKEKIEREKDPSTPAS